MNGRSGQLNLISAIGRASLAAVAYFGGVGLLLLRTVRSAWQGLAGRNLRRRRQALAFQMVRVGVRSLGIVCLVQIFIGVILALQMAPVLARWGQEQGIADIIGLSGFRMLGPIITGIVLSGFAGASIAAELGTMVVAEEIEALEAQALNPVRFLVVPRILATLVMTVLLTIIADWMIAVGGYLTARLVLGPEVWANYWRRMQEALRAVEFFSGLIMSAAFGLLIGLIACYEGLRVRGGAQGVGRATTMTVVYSIVGVIAVACVFTMIFYVFDFF